MKPTDLIERLCYLAEQAPIDAVLFRVPSGPACTYHEMRLDVSPRDVLDLLDYVRELESELDTIEDAWQDAKFSHEA